MNRTHFLMFLRNHLGEERYSRLRESVHFFLYQSSFPGQLIKTFNTGLFFLRCNYKKKELPVTGSKVSIVIPTLSKGSQANHFTKLKKLLAVYLPRQTHKNYEAIVYCDGKNERVENMVRALNDPRVRVYCTDETLAKWGHPQTRLGIDVATGDYFIRMNDDNKPYRRYLQALLSNFSEDIAVSYGRVVFVSDARIVHLKSLHRSFVLPGDEYGVLRGGNIDCMNYMIRFDIAKKNVASWKDGFAADYSFLKSILESGAKSKFIDEIIGEKH